MNYKIKDLPKKGDIVVVGMSGGVDSTLTALLLKNIGCKVIGVTMKLWDGVLPKQNSNKTIKDSCYGPKEIQNIEECRKFCTQNNIDYYEIDCIESYKKNVLEYFKNEYRNGRTPNPCIRCNQTVKFGSLLEGVQKLGIQFDYFCTGHYAKIVTPEEGIFNSDKTPCMISCAQDNFKDQSYFLYRIPSTILEKIRFPLATMTKAQVVELAKEYKLEAANREESQDFLGEEYLELLFSDKPGVQGDIIDLDGKVLGKHKGIEHYTVGQRRGLGVAVNYPVYVHSIDAKTNTVVLAKNEELNSKALIADDFVWPSDVEPKEPITAMVKIRLASKPVKALITKYSPQKDDHNTYINTPWKVTFEEEQRAVAPGQSVVLYDNNTIIGGGIITKVIQ